jgi:hypothetical protein
MDWPITKMSWQEAASSSVAWFTDLDQSCQLV